MWAIVDGYGDILSVKHLFPNSVNDDEYVIPVTLHVGHTWSEGFSAWWAAFKANVFGFS
jgi:hypothetical protein